MNMKINKIRLYILIYDLIADMKGAQNEKENNKNNSFWVCSHNMDNIRWFSKNYQSFALKA